MKLPNSTCLVMNEVYEKCGEHLEMLPSETDRLTFMSNVLAGLVAKERGNSEYLEKRIQALEKRVDVCCSKINS